MADYVGVADSRAGTLEFGRLPGFTTGRTQSGPAPVVADVGYSTSNAGAWAAGGATGVVAAEDDHVGVFDERAAMGSLWFEAMHILPREEIDFGNIITTVDESFEVFNAYRKSQRILSAIVNGASPGVEFPDGPAVLDTLQPFESFLNSTSTALSPVQQIIRATADGLPVFDNTVTFQFDGGANSVFLSVKGSRVVFFSPEYEAPVREIHSFKTDVIPGISGKQQRIALRKYPRVTYQVRCLVEGSERQRLINFLYGWQGNGFGLPIWTDQVKATAAIAIGSSSISVTSTDDCDFREGGKLVIYDDAQTYDVLEIDTVSTNTITLASLTVGEYPVGVRVAPVRDVVLVSSVTSRKSKMGLEEFSLIFQVTDNETGAPTASSSAWSTYNSRILFDDCNLVDDAGVPGRFTHKVRIIDNETGAIYLSSSWAHGQSSSEKGFMANSRSSIMALRRLLLATRGGQKAFYLPTFTDELEVVANLVSGAATLDIDHVLYSRLANAGPQRNILKITFTDGTSLVRVVSSATEISSTVERLTLDDTWPANRTSEEVERVQFYELVRFDTDDFAIDHERIGLARMRAPTVTVLDDD